MGSLLIRVLNSNLSLKFFHKKKPIFLIVKMDDDEMWNGGDEMQILRLSSVPYKNT